ncbi:D-arabinono-1,4-lactone oxidase [Anatilimnocola floriformis]|uniref:D-arabinono-1,4-lactone oxidase n=1 Tax=Anatilimnocola floriformis TaxID=2948575 RepID=UPI0020C22C7E|nr:D-arabinono-1,4-lactone oxidase [Anatilimnocola floriformis]
MADPATVSNFGGNITFTPRQHYSPRSEAEVLEILKKHRGQRIHASGSLHAWSAAAQSDDIYLTLEHLNSVEVSRDSGEPIATLGAGCQIKRALAELDKQGLTLPAVGLISEQTIAGSTATGTHGSGRHCLSHYLETVRIAHYGADGEPTITEVSGDVELAAARCSLGCLGIIVALTIRPRPQYFIEEYLAVYKNLSDVLAREFDWQLTQFYYLPWRNDFLAQHRRETTNRRSWLAPLYRWHWFLTIDIGLHLIIRFLVQRLRSPWGVKTFFKYFALSLVPRRWHVVDKSQDHLIMEHELFRHIEMEIFVRGSELAVALDFLRCAFVEFDGQRGFDDDTRAVLGQFQLLEKLNAPRERYTHHYPVCVRRVEPDETLISPSSGGDEDFYAISLISYALPAERAGFVGFCDFVAPAMTALFHGRCHWGKYCPSTPQEIERLYPKLPEFVAVCEKFDPERRFANDWQQEVIFPAK